MLTPQTLTQTLLELGFVQLANRQQFSAGQLCVQLLDGPRLRVTTPAGDLRYVAVLSPQHLTEELMQLGLGLRVRVWHRASRPAPAALAPAASPEGA